jgi:hypothetical protein
MEAKQLTAAILDGGIRSINFFNGRLLSGEDLSQEQTAHRAGQRRLGQAIGEGIAFGLEVSETLGSSTKEVPVVTVTAGLAVNRQGETLALPTRTDVSLVRPVPTSTITLSPTFKACDALPSGAYIAGTGLYLLTIAPASGSEGRAPVSGLGNTTAACNTRYTVEGVQFRLILLDVSLDDLNDANHLRNRIAYQCFGVNESGLFRSDPFGLPVERYGLLDGLRPHRLTERDVPLAILHWTANNGITFIDQWSVRRGLIAPAVSGRWEGLLGDRRLREAEAMLLQFQEQVLSIRANETNLESIVATERFDYLPSVGILPLSGVRSSRGFDYPTFFRNQIYRGPSFIDSAQVESLLHDALSYPPIAVSGKEMLWLYRVRENIQAIDTSTSAPPQAFLIFTSGYITYRGAARFNLARVGYSNYAQHVL